MIYLFGGNNIKKSHDKAHHIIDTLLEKKSDAGLFFVDSDNFSKDKFQEYIEGQSLFEERHIVYSSILSRNNDAIEYIEKNIKDIKKSPNIFIFIEDGFNKLSKVLEKNSVKTQISEKKEKVIQKFNIFSLGDALGRKDGIKLWTTIQCALISNIDIKEILPTLLWQIKNILIVKKVKGIKESGLNAFPYSKALSFSKNFSLDELCLLSKKLMKIHMDEREGKRDLTLSLEKFALWL